jgi:hypothetical protein
VLLAELEDRLRNLERNFHYEAPPEGWSFTLPPDLPPGFWFRGREFGTGRFGMTVEEWSRVPNFLEGFVAPEDRDKVIDSRSSEGGRVIRRRRQCLVCDRRFTTYEKIGDSIADDIPG